MRGFKDFFFGSVFAGMVILFGASVGPDIEGKVFPVFIDVKVTKVEPIGPLSVRIWGTGIKVRESCVFQNLQWFVGNDITSADAPVLIEEPTRARHRGVFEFGPWRVKVRPDEFERSTFAYAYHRCHPFWLTRTKLYPPTDPATGKAVFTSGI